MNMSMDKPMALNCAKGTRGPQVEKCKNDVKKNEVARVNLQAKYGGRKGNLQAF